MLLEKYYWAIQKTLFVLINQHSTFSHTREYSKMFNITSKYFKFFNNKPPASLVTLITRVFFACYSRLRMTPFLHLLSAWVIIMLFSQKS